MQVSPDSVSVQRRPLDLEDYIDIGRRNINWIFGPLFAGLVIGVVVAFFWPDTYLAWSTFRVAPAQVPDRVVPSNFNRQMSDRLTSVFNQITSREKLIPIISSTGIYKSELAKLPMDDVVEEMKKAIRITPLASGPQESRLSYLFQLSFKYRNRRDAIATVGQLAETVRRISETEQQNASDATSQLLKDERDEAKKALDSLEQTRAQFRQAKFGSLPEQLATNLQALQSLQMQLGSVNEAINRNGQEKLMLETQLQNLKEQAKAATAVQEENNVKSERLLQLNKAILDMETSLSALRETYREEHPDIRTTKARLDVLKREQERLSADEEKAAAVQSGKKTASAQTRRMQTDIQAMQRNIESRIHVTSLDLQERTKAQQRLTAEINRLQKMVESTPTGEDTYAKIMRDYDLAKARYDDLTLKTSQADMAKKVETQKQGETLEILEKAIAAMRPVEPNRWLIVFGGLAAGMMLGMGIAALREAKDASLKSLKDVRAYTNVAVLSTIPLLENGLVVKRKRRLAFLAWSTATIVGIVLMSSSIYYYFNYVQRGTPGA